MKIKTIAMSVVLGASLSGGQSFAGGNHYVEHPVQRITTYHIVYKRPAGEWHQHPKNPFTNDTYHNHANGHNYHEHNYGKGATHSHTTTGYTYEICSYPRYQ